ncbi:MAG: recombinase family protein [Saprospiraceae bacterium]
MNIGYARVSTKEQNLDLQKDALEKAGCVEVFEEKVSGAGKERPQLTKLVEKLRQGDVLTVWKLDRLGRSIKDLIHLVNKIQNKGAELKSLHDHIDTTTPQGKLTFHMFAALAEFEKDIIRERTLAGLATARARGRVGGRPKGLSQKAEHIAIIAQRLYEEGQKTITEICEELSISRATLYNYLRHRGIDVGQHRNKTRFLKAELWLLIQTNSIVKKSLKKCIEAIEFFILQKFKGKPDEKNKGIYRLTIPYQSAKELDLTVNQTIRDIRNTCDLHNCSVEVSIKALDKSEKSWK